RRPGRRSPRSGRAPRPAGRRGAAARPGRGAGRGAPIDLAVYRRRPGGDNGAMVGRRAILTGPAARAIALAAVLAGAAATAAAEGRRARPNLPDGWRWPPTAATRAAGRACMEELRALGVRFERASQRRLIATPIVI